MAKRNLWGNVNMHVDGPAPRALLKEVRFRCFANGGDLGSTHDIKRAILEHGWDNPELQRSHFHPDYLCRTAGQWSSNWRLSSQKFKGKVLAQFVERAINQAIEEAGRL